MALLAEKKNLEAKKFFDGVGSIQEENPRWGLLAACHYKKEIPLIKKWERWIKSKGKKTKTEPHGTSGKALYVYQKWWGHNLPNKRHDQNPKR